MSPEQEALANAVVAASEKTDADERTYRTSQSAYRTALREALAGGVTQAELARRTGKHRETLRLDADADKRATRIAKRTKSGQVTTPAHPD